MKSIGWAFVMILAYSAAYRHGEPIDTDLRLNNEIMEAHSHQQPHFGVNSHTKLRRDPSATSMSLSFEDGLWGLPTYAMQKGKDHLYRIVVTFIYTRNSIETIQGESIYTEPRPNHPPEDIQVEYHWIREHELSMQAGGFVMMLCVFLVSIFFFLSACGIGDAIDEDVHHPRHSMARQESGKRL